MISPVTLDDLNQFRVLQIERQGETTLITGRMSKRGQPYVDEHVHLFNSLDEHLSGYLIEVDPDANRAVLGTPTEYLHPSVVPGASFPMYDSYWSDRIRLVLNRGITWTRQVFV
jgi:hypothetical protein